jgi:hypothetical protein
MYPDVTVEIRTMMAKGLLDNYGCMEYGKRVMFNILGKNVLYFSYPLQWKLRKHA